MPKSKLLNGLPHDLVHSFFSTPRFYQKGYMSDWIVNTALRLNTNHATLDIINPKTVPLGFGIKPILKNLRDLHPIVDKVVQNAGFPEGFINKAIFEIQVNNRSLRCRAIVSDVNGKEYCSPEYLEESYIIFKTGNLTILDVLVLGVQNFSYKIRRRLFPLRLDQIGYTQKVKNQMGGWKD